MRDQYYSIKKPNTDMLKEGLAMKEYDENSIIEELWGYSDDSLLEGVDITKEETIWVLHINQPVKILKLTSENEIKTFYNNNKNLFKNLPDKRITFNFEKIKRYYDVLLTDLWVFNSFFRGSFESRANWWANAIWFNWVFDEPKCKKIEIKYHDDFLTGTIKDFKDSNEIDTKKLSFNELKNKAIETSSVKVRTRQTVVNEFVRSPHVEAYAKRWAQGICQLCEKPAPFSDKKGEPYLESHHIEWLSRGGTDKPENVIALCPNCHTKMHIVDSKEDIQKLYNKIRMKEL